MRILKTFPNQLTCVAIVLKIRKPNKLYEKPLPGCGPQGPAWVPEHWSFLHQVWDVSRFFSRMTSESLISKPIAIVQKAGEESTRSPAWVRV